MIGGGDQELTKLIQKQDHLAVLRHIRTHRIRCPKLVIQHAKSLLGSKFNSSSSLSDDERLSVLEQLLLAALDISNPELADQCLIAIRQTKGVPSKSTRVRRLIGQCLESTGSTEKAEEIYNQLTDENPANAIALKRKYTLLAAVPGKEMEARKALVEYIEYQLGDAGAWMEMYHSCMIVADYKGASYSLEEVLISSPLDGYIHCLLGELYATMGGIHNLKLARKHLSMSLELKSAERGNLRALYSLLSASDAFVEECSRLPIKSGKKNQKEFDVDHEVQVSKELIKYGSERILALYSKNAKGSKIGKVVNDVIATYKDPM